MSRIQMEVVGDARIERKSSSVEGSVLGVGMGCQSGCGALF